MEALETDGLATVAPAEEPISRAQERLTVSEG